MRLFEFIQGFSRPLEVIGGFFRHISRFFKSQVFSSIFFCQIKENQNIHPQTFWAVYPKLLNLQQHNAYLSKAPKLFFQMSGVRVLCDKNSSRYGPESYSHFFLTRLYYKAFAFFCGLPFYTCLLISYYILPLPFDYMYLPNDYFAF